MRSLYSFIRKNSEGIIITTCVVVLFLGSYIPLLDNAIRAPADRLYLGFDEYPIDVLWAIDIMRQGYNGHWGAFLQFSTTLPEVSGFIKLEYLLMGKFARLVGMDVVAVLLLVRFFVSLIYVFVVIRIISAVFSRKLTRIVAYILTFFGASIAISPAMAKYLGSAHDAGVFQRMTDASFHHILGGLLTWISLFALYRSIRHGYAHREFFVAVISGMIASLVYAPAMMLVIMSIPVSWVLSVLLKKGNESELGNWNPGKLLLYVILAAVPMIYVRHVTGVLWAPHNFSHNETLNPFAISFGQYPLAMGMTYIVSFFAIPLIWKKPTAFLLLILPWLIAHPIGEYIVSPMFSINRIRFFLTPYHVAFGILAAYVVEAAGFWVAKKPRQVSAGAWATVCIAALLTTGLYAYKTSFRASHVAYTLGDNFSFGYPKRDLVAAMQWLERNTSEHDRVLTYLYTGNMVPPFSGNRIVTSWWHRLAESPGLYPLLASVESFYRGTMTPTEAQKFVQILGIDYVLYSDTERLAGLQNLPYAFLTSKYAHGSVTLYQVTAK